jgi:predicted RNase H-like HicB family nuclease
MKDEYIFKVLFERADNGGYLASVPILPSCYATGPTLETARQRVAEAIRCYCLNQLEFGGSIPQNRAGLPVMVDEVKVCLETAQAPTM